MNKELAWFLGFLTSDGSIVRPSYRSKGNETHICFCIHYDDREVLYKIKEITNTKASVRTYPNYKSPQSQITIYNRKDLIEKYGNIKAEIPNIEGFERHYLRGVFDGDGCLYKRKNRNSFSIQVINENYQIAKGISKILSEKLGIKYKEPKYKNKDHIYILSWEGRVSKLIAWYLYHGNIYNCTLKRKMDYYKKHVVVDNCSSYTDELYKTLGLKKIGNYISMQVQHSKTLEWCHIVQSLLNFKTVPVPHKKGQKFYYSLYLPATSTQGASSITGYGTVQ